MIVLVAALVPLAAQGALVVEDASGARAFLDAAAQYAPSLAPAEIGRLLQREVGVDLLAEPPEWHLAPGPRVLAFSRNAAGLAAPVRSAAAARRALTAWLASRSGRVGVVSKGRLLTASGRGAPAMLKMLTLSKPLKTAGPLTWYARLGEPLRNALLSVDASASGLVFSGTVTASSPILAGPAPAGCDGAFAGCLRAGLGPAGRGALSQIVRQDGLARATRVVERLDGVDPRRLWPPYPDATFDGAPAPSGPALWGSLDVAQVAAALLKLTPLDAVSSEPAAVAYAAQLLYGELLKHLGPAALEGDPGPKNTARIEARLPLH
ncbi:MAG TPA: hypothetical protein VLW85_13175 [Myxococcales bacterium]|nr:hypothetical protein [Myxococcales bacterium]